MPTTPHSPLSMKIMPFRELPRCLRGYILAHPVVLALLTVAVLYQSPPRHWWLVGLLVLVVVVLAIALGGHG